MQGLAILTVIKAGFLGSARFGSGLVVARLNDGSWSAPSAIMTAGGGFGGQIGFELTDFIFILNDSHAVKTFAQQGSITLGGNVSIAAGPVGRNAEAAGAASLKSVAGIFSYSKTRGLFAGVSLEGSAIIERRDANEKLYGQRYTAQQLLSGTVRPPPQAAPLMNVLTTRAFNGTRQGSFDDGMYNDVPVYGEDHGNNSGYNNAQNNGYYGAGNEFGDRKRSNTWQDDVYDRPAGVSRSNTIANDDYEYRDRPASTGSGFKKPAPPPPKGPKPTMGQKNQAVAQFAFDGEQSGDLSFKKGEIITVLKKTDSENDWWYVSRTGAFPPRKLLTTEIRTGMIGQRHGIFPANYVKMQ